MKIAVVGTGGVGGYFGAQLAQARHEVTFIARGAHLEAIREKGLQVRSVRGDILIHPARATDAPADVGPVDLVVFCTKTYDTASAAAAAKPMVGPGTTVVSLQNGLEAHEHIGRLVGMEHMLAGLTGIIAWVDAPGIIRNDSPEPWIVIGELDGRFTPRLRAVEGSFQQAGVAIESTAHILEELWRKLLLIAPMAALGSLTRLPVGGYRDVPEARALMLQLRAEIVSVASAEHVLLAQQALDDTLAATDLLPPTTRTSMQLDVAAGRRTELESIIGVICRKGRLAGLATPAADMVYAALKPVDEEAQRNASARERS